MGLGRGRGRGRGLGLGLGLVELLLLAQELAVQSLTQVGLPAGLGFLQPKWLGDCCTLQG